MKFWFKTETKLKNKKNMKHQINYTKTPMLMFVMFQGKAGC